MQPLLITSLVALLIALIKIRSLQEEYADLAEDLKYQYDRATDWYNRFTELRDKHDGLLIAANKCGVDNALLKAELKKKHRRVPQL